MRIAVYGGSFDPITLAHEEIINRLSEEFDQVLVIPSYESTVKTFKASFDDRIRMCIEWELKDNVIVSSISEITDGTTYDLMEKVKTNRGHEHDYHIVIGQDQAMTFEKWVKAEQLISKYKFVVFGRGYSSGSEMWFKKEPNIFFEMDNSISSSEFRNTLNFDLLNENVANYIIDNKLYLPNNNTETSPIVETVDSNEIGNTLGDIKHYLEADKKILEKNGRQNIAKGLHRALKLIDGYADDYGIEIR